MAVDFLKRLQKMAYVAVEFLRGIPNPKVAVTVVWTYGATYGTFLSKS